ncbi:hypothetical protein BAUCODRAFT_426002 [Baudoinia panamericana UAMH 10762]|uniref:Carboxymuconolactone decarboxylase-like domain-containing protein n=1 Tax=Baudoinia panamericana (strain UAMH 10762) TaxID=717646 RepID=M2NHC7_BAUPA|nr:uncharacterized protein BAUCODRAFT_426002 [Baudoinia panamericana UAMH 10762]EMC98430.1 hypothetical protein BAUCODRAFT_426002 [Baudoinia panamericana UAMH 10762]
MSTRIPSKPRSELRPDQQEMHDHFMEIVGQSSHPGAAERAGRVFLPFLVLAPQIGRLSVDMLQAVEGLPSLPADARETASLACTTFFRCDFATYAHSAMPVKLGLLTQSQADAIASGQKPDDLNKGCSLAYDVTRQLLEVRGALPQDLWDACVRQFGQEGA